MVAQNKLLISLVVAIIVVFTVIFFISNHSTVAGVTVPTCGDITSCTTGNYYVSGTITGGEVQSLDALTASSTIVSGGLTATSTGTTVTLAASDFVGYSTISVTPRISTATLTLPASSTLSAFLPNAGDRVSISVINATSTAGVNVTLAGGSGTLLQLASTTSSIRPGGMATLNVVRKANSDIIFQMIPSI
jgi:hypothetical protein